MIAPPASLIQKDKTSAANLLHPEVSRYLIGLYLDGHFLDVRETNDKHHCALHSLRVPLTNPQCPSLSVTVSFTVKCKTPTRLMRRRCYQHRTTVMR